MDTPSTLEGGCFCGAVRYRAAGTPFNSTVCHCTACRRSAGAAAVAWFSVHPRDFALTRGSLREHSSSLHGRRGFCADCGSSVTFRNESLPNEIDIATATLDDPARVPPRDHVWTASRLPWVGLLPGLPHYPRGRRGGA